MRRFTIIFFVLILLLSHVATVWAEIGVGVNLGKIQITDTLTPGGSYRLPAIGVINTGDEANNYEVIIIYMLKQEEHKPPGKWFRFDPQSFPLEPKTAQQVTITLSIPMNAQPGDYFALIEAHPVSDNPGVSIGVAAATKLYFSVRPANILVAIQARISSFVENTSPYSYAGLGVITLVVLAFVFRRFFRIRFRLERRD